MANAVNVGKLYKTVVDDVTNSVREAFLDEGLDEHVLQELKSLWENKLHQSKALAGNPATNVTLSQTQQMRMQQQRQPIHIQTQHRPVQGNQPRTMALPIFTQLGEGVDLTGAATAATMALPPQLYQQQLGGITLQQTSQGHLIAIPQGANIQAMSQPIQLPTTQAFIPQHVQQMNPSQQVVNTHQSQGRPAGQSGSLIQLDGANDTSSEEDDYDDDDDDNEDGGNEDDETEGKEEEPLCSDDDVDEEDPLELFDTENVVVCQYDKINRAKNRWKFHLKDGIMNLDGRDYVFQKANGDAEW